MKLIRILVPLLAAVELNCVALTIPDPKFDPTLHYIVERLQSLAGDDYVDQQHESLDIYLTDEEKTPDDPYRYFLLDHSDDQLIIRAENNTGGRSYIYDSHWESVRYEFHSDKECISIGKQILEWELKGISDNRKRQVLVSLGWRGLYNSKKDILEYALLDIYSSLGPFLKYPELRDDIWAIIFQPDSKLSDANKRACLNSIISCFDEYPEDLQQVVVDQVQRYVKKRDESGDWYDIKIRPWINRKVQGSETSELLKRV